MKWAIVLLCVILGAFASLRASGRSKDFRRPVDDD